MAIFIYQGYDKNGELVKGEFASSSKESALAHLEKRGITPTSIRDATDPGKGLKKELAITLFDHVTPVDILFLVRNMSVTLKAGLSVVESLDNLISDTSKKSLRRILEQVRIDIQNGRPLSAGFEAHKEFPSIFLGMLKAGEISGRLDETLTQLGVYLSKEYSLREKVRAALIYPAILLISSVAIILLLLVFVIPRLTRSFAQSNLDLPLITKIFLKISDILTWSITLDLAIVASIIWFFTGFRRTPRGARMFLKVFSKVPVANELIRKVALVRFARTFANLIGSGISAIESLNLAGGSIGNFVYEEAIRDAAKKIQNGATLSDAFRGYPELFPRIFLSVMVVGERSGSLQQVLTTFADFYEEEVDITLKNMTAILEPALLLVMGLVVGGIAISILLPIYKLVGNFL